MSNDKIADLKAKFVAGAIPREADYATLLNMLEETRAATGTSPDAPKSTSLRLTNGGYLDVAVAAVGGLVTGASGLSTDARLLWARNHAISTGATQYGYWDGGYAFIYTKTGTTDKRKMQVCMPSGHGVIDNVNAFGLFNAAGVKVVDCYVNGTYEDIPGWTARAGTWPNTWEFVHADTIYNKLVFIYTPHDNAPTYWANITFATV